MEPNHSIISLTYHRFLKQEPTADQRVLMRELAVPGSKVVIGRRFSSNKVERSKMQSKRKRSTPSMQPTEQITTQNSKSDRETCKIKTLETRR